MWVCLKDAFFSLVAYRGQPDKMLVRARNRDHLEQHFGEYEIIENGGTDYGYRAIVPRDVVAKKVSDEVMSTTATNFKDSVLDDDLHNMYMYFWNIHYDYQQLVNKKKKKKLG